MSAWRQVAGGKRGSAATRPMSTLTKQLSSADRQTLPCADLPLPNAPPVPAQPLQLTWNIRDSHFLDTVQAIRQHLSRRRPADDPPRLVLWAHNSHLGGLTCCCLWPWQAGRCGWTPATLHHASEVAANGSITFFAHQICAQACNRPTNHLPCRRRRTGHRHGAAARGAQHWAAVPRGLWHEEGVQHRVSRLCPCRTCGQKLLQNAP